ncbi:MAG: hypothetical protein Q7R30_01350 [Acidobacteriota bacterium]|nr:hypothetical protein [Acidobacteriota bacterium]
MWLTLLISLVTIAAAATDRQTRTLPLPAGRALAIDITVGSIRLEGWDRPDAEIEIERRAPSTGQLARLPIAIDESPSRVHVRVVQAAGATDPAIRADIVIRLPRDAVVERVQVLEGKLTINAFRGTLSADLRRGPIEGADLSGVLRLETGIGSIVLASARLSPNGLLRLRAFNGDVRLTLAERPADARVLALALNGHIRSDIPLTMKDTWGPRWGEATLGTGEPVISLDVVTGTIEIRSPR